MLHRTLVASIILGTLLVSASASAQSADAPAPALNAPAPAPAAAAGTDSSTTAVHSADISETTATAPTPSLEGNVPNGDGLPAPAAKPCGFISRPCSYPHFAVALEGGVAHFNESGPFGFHNGVGAGTTAGPSWGLRVGLELRKWIAVDLHYVGMDNHATDSLARSGAVGLFTSAATAEVRFTLPLKYVQPYLFTGAGVYSTSATGSDTARSGSPFFGSTELGVPIGLGVAVPLTNALSLGGEMTYHRLFGESFATDDAVGGGDLTTFNLLLRGKL